MSGMDRSDRWSCLRWAISAGFVSMTISVILCGPTVAQQLPNEEAPGMVKFNFPEEIEIKVLVDYVSARLGIKVLYDEQVANNKLTVKAPGEIPVTSLLSILESALRMKGLVLVDADPPGWKRIIKEAPTEKMGSAGQQIVVEFYEARHAEAVALAEQVTRLITARKTSEGAATVELTHDERTNQIAIIGDRLRVEEVLKLFEAWDVPLDMTTQVYAFRYVAADRIDRLVRELLDPAVVKRLYRSAIDDDDNLLLVTASPEIHQRITALRQQLDLESTPRRSPVRFYRLKFADAVEVLQTLQAVETAGAPTPAGIRGVSGQGRGTRGVGAVGVERVGGSEYIPGPNRPAQLGSELTMPPAYRNPNEGGAFDYGPGIPGAIGVPGESEASSPFLIPGTGNVTADPHSNSLIVVAPPAVQRTYEELIRALDRRRPQVLIEAKVVMVDTSDNFSLGVEFATGDRKGSRRLFEFTSFGLSEVDPVTGALSLIPGRGFNFTLVDPDSADLVLRALTSHSRSRVLSSPRILVNDNERGTLTSVSEVPFTSINASNTVATTSFAGFAEAGTTIEATPRIGEGDAIELDYSVRLNTFTGEGSGGAPPPRKTDEVRSVVTIPDGHTLIVGGLNRENQSSSIDGLPFVESIPVLRHLTSSGSKSKSASTLFVFLKPMILRDDKFRDLRFISDRDLQRARLSGRFPFSDPVSVKEIAVPTHP